MTTSDRRPIVVDREQQRFYCCETQRQRLDYGREVKSWLDNYFELFFLLALIVVVIIAMFTLSGCCGLSKRSCFPACPPPKLVQVENTCELPPKVMLDQVNRADCAEHPTWNCFSPAEAAKLAKNLAALKAWIRETRARCSNRP